MPSPFEQALLAKRDDPAFVPNEDGIWCPSCGNQIVPPHLMHDESIELPKDCNECGYPDSDEVAEFHAEKKAGDVENATT